MASPSSGPANSLQVRRVFPASREKMFAMWTRPEHLEHWMCRPDPQNVVKYRQHEFRVGGKRLIENKAADGGVFMNRGEYLEIKPPEKLVFTWAWERFDASGKKTAELDGTVVTVEFHDRGEFTEVILTHEFFPDSKMRDLHGNGWNLCFDRLQEHLDASSGENNVTKTRPASETSLQIRRTFAAPREKVFAAWTKRELLERWMCRDVPTQDPRYVELDVRPGARYAIEIKTPEGVTYLGQGTFREVKPPEKLVFTWAWTSSPESKTEELQKEESIVTVELFDRGASTEMVFTHEKLSGVPSRDAHNKGWEGCFEVLTKVLESPAAH
jgi:uncharacterized protein YndB with AHSA1/START domain